MSVLRDEMASFNRSGSAFQSRASSSRTVGISGKGERVNQSDERISTDSMGQAEVLPERYLGLMSVGRTIVRPEVAANAAKAKACFSSSSNAKTNALALALML